MDTLSPFSPAGPPRLTSLSRRKALCNWPSTPSGAHKKGPNSRLVKTNSMRPSPSNGIQRCDHYRSFPAAAHTQPPSTSPLPKRIPLPLRPRPKRRQNPHPRRPACRRLRRATSNAAPKTSACPSASVRNASNPTPKNPIHIVTEIQPRLPLPLLKPPLASLKSELRDKHPNASPPRRPQPISETEVPCPPSPEKLPLALAPSTAPAFFSSQGYQKLAASSSTLLPRAAEPIAVVCGGIEYCAPDYQLRRKRFSPLSIEFVARGHGARRTSRPPAARPLRRRPLRLRPRHPPRHRQRRRPSIVKYFVDFQGDKSRPPPPRQRLPRPRSGHRASAPEQILRLYEDLADAGLRWSPTRNASSALLLEQHNSSSASLRNRRPLPRHRLRGLRNLQRLSPLRRNPLPRRQPRRHRRRLQHPSSLLLPPLPTLRLHGRRNTSSSSPQYATPLGTSRSPTPSSNASPRNSASPTPSSSPTPSAASTAVSRGQFIQLPPQRIHLIPPRSNLQRLPTV